MERLTIRVDPKATAFEHRFTVTARDVERAGTADDPLDWYAVQTNPNCEERATAHLFERGFVAYLPRETNWHRATRRGKAEATRVPKTRPLMTGYVFVGLCRNQHKRFDLVRGTDGVRGLVGVNGQPFMIPEGFVKALADREERGVFDHTRPTQARNKAGDKVKIVQGAFAGQVAEVLGEIEDGRLRVEIAELFGMAVPVDLDDDHVEQIAA